MSDVYVLFECKCFFKSNSNSNKYFIIDCTIFPANNHSIIRFKNSNFIDRIPTWNPTWYRRIFYPIILQRFRQ